MARPLTRTRVGRFELVHRFAIGGMGEIFLARERGVAGFDRQVVVKLLIPELAEQPDLVTLFIDEARIAANLAHPNIVQIFDFGRDDGGYFLAMEYVPGQNLARICARASRDPRDLLTRALAVHVVAEMARGLDYAHHARDTDGKPLGIVHRDVSPHNLLLSIHGDVKVMDFGIAKAANTLHRTATGVVRGKFGYMSPEQLAGDSLDATTDIYSAGIVLWELTLMRRLWPGQDDLAILDQARAGRVPRPTEIDPTYPTDLEEIVMHAVARDRTQRTSSAAALASDLRGWLALQGAVIERTALGAVVKELFPEIDHETPARPEADAQPGTASLPKPTTTTTPAAPLAAGALGSAKQHARGSRRGAMIALAALAVVGGGTYALTTFGDHDAPPVQASRIADAAPAHVDQRPPPAPVDAAVVTVVDDASAPGSAAVVPPPDRHKPSKPRHEPKPTAHIAADTTTTTPQPLATPELGELKVQATPWATVQVAGNPSHETPWTYHLAPGEYPISMTLPEGAGTIRATATVMAKTTTKCIGDAKTGLSCR